MIDAGGYAQAGRLLNLSHSAIHRQIRMLEQELNCQLLVRSGRNVQPTESGRLLADLTARMRQAISDAQRQVNDLNNLRSGHLRIGTTSSILVSFLPAVLQRFSKKFPGVRLHITTGIADDLIEDVVDGNLDLGIVFNPTDLSRPMPKLQFEILYREEFDWAVGRNHPLSTLPHVGVRDLVAYPLITLPPQSHIRRACDRWFAAKGVVPTVVTELENEEAIDKLVEVNMGFALRSTRRPPNARIRCFQIANSALQCEVGIVLLERNYIPRVITEFVGMCRETRMRIRSRARLRDRKCC